MPAEPTVQQPTLLEQLTANQEAQSDMNMAAVTLFGNLTNWRSSFKNDAEHRRKVLVGRAKIFSLLDRFNVV